MTEPKRTRGAGTAYDARRRQIVDAVLRIVGEHGLDRVSVRDVALGAGVSVGRVQHYFRTKDQLLQAAFEHINELGAELVGKRLAEAGDSSPRAVLRAIATELLPLDDQHRQSLQIGLAFTARAVVEPEFAAQLKRGYDELHQLFVLLLTRAREDGETAPELDPDHEASLLLGLAEGVSTHALVGHHTPESALAVVDTQLDRIFGR